MNEWDMIGTGHYTILIKFGQTLGRFKIIGNKYADWCPNFTNPNIEFRKRASDHIVKTIIKHRLLLSRQSDLALRLSLPRNRNQYP